jgi:hydroxyethylthiazole kinase
LFKEMLEAVRQQRPLIHNITNYVTANDCANLLLACGASPIMADDPEEAAEITALCAGLCINLGTLNHSTVPAMLAAGKRAGELGRPAVLDPVGAGASRLRTETALRLLREVPFTAVRCNLSELKTLAYGSTTAKGVDAGEADRITEENLAHAAALVKDFSRRHRVIAAVTGPIDIVTDGERALCIRNGIPMMSAVTGTGCQLSSLTAAFLAANPGQPLKAAAAAVCAMGLCGETACRRLTGQDGNASFRSYIIDTLYHLTPDGLEKGANYEVL